MPKYRRIEFEGAWYHVMNRGAGRVNIFFAERNYLKFIELLDEVIMLYGIEVHAYCLMGNHYHLIIHTPKGNLSSAMRHLGLAYTKYINLWLGRDGPIFKGRYNSIVVDDESYLLTLCAYIHRNPVKDGFVESLSAYHWSSYHAYTGGRSELRGLRTDEIWARYERRAYQGSFEEFVLRTNTQALEDFYNQPMSLVLGNNAFVDRLLKENLLEDFKDKIARIDEIEPWTVDEVVQRVADYFQIGHAEVIAVGHGATKYAKAVAMWMCRMDANASLAEIAKYFNGIGQSAVSKQLSRAKKDPKIEQIRKDIKSGTGN